MKKDLPIYNESRSSIIFLHHLSFIVTKIFFFISGSNIKVRQDWKYDNKYRYVIAANHVYWYDPFVVTTALGWKRLRPMLPCRFIAAPKFLAKWWLRAPMRKLGAYPSHPFLDWPYGIDASVNLLDQGSTIVIFPQGRITRDRTLPAKRGVKILSDMENVLVVPVYMKRTSKGIFQRYQIVVGEPENMSELSEQEIMNKVFELDAESEILIA